MSKKNKDESNSSGGIVVVVFVFLAMLVIFIAIVALNISNALSDGQGNLLKAIFMGIFQGTVAVGVLSGVSCGILVLVKKIKSKK